MELKNALKEALEAEHTGYRLYNETANITQNPLIKKVFEYLSLQEIKHINEIEIFIEKSFPDETLEGDSTEETTKFFNYAINEFKDKLEKASEDEEKAFNIGMGLEENATDFYKNLLDNSQNEEVIKFFAFLIEQEKAHYSLIKNTRDYLNDTNKFFDEHSGRMITD